jgi:four helix bundle protein
LRKTRKRRIPEIAAGSASELEYHFLLAHDLNFSADLHYEQLNNGVVTVKRMLAALLRKVDADRLAG